MSGSPSQQDVETSILLMLAEEARLTGCRLLPRQVAKKFIPAIGETQAQLSLKHLESIRLVSGALDNLTSMGFAITRNGMLSVKERFDHVNDGKNSSYHLKDEFFGDDNIRALAAECTYVLPIPPDVEDKPPPGPIPVIIHNHVNPVFNNIGSIADKVDDQSHLVRSQARASWFSGWVSLLAAAVALAAIVASLWVAGKVF